MRKYIQLRSNYLNESQINSILIWSYFQSIGIVLIWFTITLYFKSENRKLQRNHPVLLNQDSISNNSNNNNNNNNNNIKSNENPSKNLKKHAKKGSFDISETGTFMAKDFIIGETGVKGVPNKNNNNDNNNTIINQDDTNNISNNSNNNNNNNSQSKNIRSSNRLGMELKLEDLVRIGDLGRGKYDSL